MQDPSTGQVFSGKVGLLLLFLKINPSAARDTGFLPVLCYFQDSLRW